MKRWTKSARSGVLPIVDVSHDVEDVEFSPRKCYKEICPRYIRIATEGCRRPETFNFLTKVADELDRLVLQFQNCQVSSDQEDMFLRKIKEIGSSIDGSTPVKGFKKKEGRRGAKRLKGFIECKLSKRKKKDGPSASQTKVLFIYVILIYI